MSSNYRRSESGFDWMVVDYLICSQFNPLICDVNSNIYSVHPKLYTTILLQSFCHPVATIRANYTPPPHLMYVQSILSPINPHLMSSAWL